MCLLYIVCVEIGCQSLTRRGVNFPAPPALPPSARFEVGTSSFLPGGSIPDVFTCAGQNISPELAWIGRPDRTRSFVLIMEDTDALKGHSIHWVVYNIPASATGLVEETPSRGDLAEDTRQGVNDFGKLGYSGPCPPAGATHRYVFKLYALDRKLPPRARVNGEYIKRVMEGHVVAEAQIRGVYSRQPLGSSQ